ncbi:MAG: hypothetical protein ABIY55_14380, partial [Kofleriaceae bacterium]
MSEREAGDAAEGGSCIANSQHECRALPRAGSTLAPSSPRARARGKSTRLARAVGSRPAPNDDASRAAPDVDALRAATDIDALRRPGTATADGTTSSAAIDGEARTTATRKQQAGQGDRALDDRVRAIVRAELAASGVLAAPRRGGLRSLEVDAQKRSVEPARPRGALVPAAPAASAGSAHARDPARGENSG